MSYSDPTLKLLRKLKRSLKKHEQLILAGPYTDTHSTGMGSGLRLAILEVDTRIEIWLRLGPNKVLSNKDFDRLVQQELNYANNRNA